MCSDPTKQALYGPCCELQRIAIAGSGGTPQATPAFFADTPGDLQKALGTILSLVSQKATSRTVPAYAPSTSGSPFASTSGATTTNASVYLASFDPSIGKPWVGDIVRERYDCKYAAGAFTVPPPVPDPSQGDSFADDVNSGGGSLARTFIALEPAAILEHAVSTHDSTLTIRPYITGSATDGSLDLQRATTFAGPESALLSNLYARCARDHRQHVPLHVDVDVARPGDAVGGRLHDGDPRLRDGAGVVQRDGDRLPVRVARRPRPRRHLPRDARRRGPAERPPAGPALYTAFETNISPPRARTSSLRAASNDGMLHAFWADETTRENNEFWAMIPPAAVMPDLPSSYPTFHEYLLDG